MLLMKAGVRKWMEQCTVRGGHGFIMILRVMALMIMEQKLLFLLKKIMLKIFLILG